MRRLLCTLFVWAASVYPALSATIDVPADQPTIQAGIDSATEGDTVLVAPGEYTEVLTIGAPSITLLSSGGDSLTTIFGSIRYAPQTNDSSVIDGFTVKNAGVSGHAIESTMNHPRIFNCTLEGFWGQRTAGALDIVGGSCLIRKCRFIDNLMSSAGGAHILMASNVVVDSCVFQGNSGGSMGGAIEISICKNVVFSNNLVVDNSVSAYRGGVVLCFCDTNVVISNNTIVGNHYSGYSDESTGVGITSIRSDSIEIFNNIIAFNDGSVAVSCTDSLPSHRLEYNDVYANDSWYPSQYHGVTPGSGSISTEPGFVNWPEGDFRLRSRSECIDAGDPAPVYNDLDGTRNDLGALSCNQFADTDLDGILDGVDNCRFTANPAQADADDDGDGDVCDVCPDDSLNDYDYDGLCHGVDLCPDDSLNDIDGDGFCGDVDNCPFLHNPDQSDIDADDVGDSCDTCPTIWNPSQHDDAGCCCELRGDCDRSGVINVSDLTYFVASLFAGGSPISCQEEGDIDDSGSINVSDLTFMVAFLFQSGAPPPPCP